MITEAYLYYEHYKFAKSRGGPHNWGTGWRCFTAVTAGEIPGRTL